MHSKRVNLLRWKMNPPKFFNILFIEFHSLLSNKVFCCQVLWGIIGVGILIGNKLISKRPTSIPFIDLSFSPKELTQQKWESSESRTLAFTIYYSTTKLLPSGLLTSEVYEFIQFVATLQRIPQKPIWDHIFLLTILSLEELSNSPLHSVFWFAESISPWCANG